MGPLVDGSVGAVIAGSGERTPDGPALRDVPVGRYRIAGRYLAPGLPVRPLLLRIRNTGPYVPALTADFDEVLQTLYRIEMDVSLYTAFIFDGDFESAATGEDPVRGAVVSADVEVHGSGVRVGPVRCV